MATISPIAMITTITINTITVAPLLSSLLAWETVDDVELQEAIGIQSLILYGSKLW